MTIESVSPGGITIVELGKRSADCGGFAAAFY
jgi:hypothetical protein